MLDTNVLNLSSIENNFNKARVLQQRNEIPKALAIYQGICTKLEQILRSNPLSNQDILFLPLSLEKISDIYKDKQDVKKALAFMKCRTHFFQYIAANKPNRENENSTDDADGTSFPDFTLDELFSEMQKCFDMEDMPPPPDPQKYVQRFLEEKKKQDEQTAKDNMRRLQEMLEERQRRLENSKWEQTLEWVSNHPIKLAFGCILFLITFLIIALKTMSFDDIDPGKDLRRLREEASRKAHESGSYEREKKMAEENRKARANSPKMTEEEMKKFQDIMEQLKKQRNDKEEQMKQSRKEL